VKEREGIIEKVLKRSPPMETGPDKGPSFPQSSSVLVSKKTQNYQKCMLFMQQYMRILIFFDFSGPYRGKKATSGIIPPQYVE